MTKATPDQLIRIKLFDLVEDPNLAYRKVNDYTVDTMRKAFAAGVALPPILIDAATRRIVDGRNRRHAYEEEYGQNYEVEVMARTYTREADIMRDALYANAGHGTPLSNYDRINGYLLAKSKFRMKLSDIAAALNMTAADLRQLVIRKTAKRTTASGGTAFVPLKHSISHLAGQQLSPAQVTVNRSLSGQRPTRLVHELTTLLTNNLWDKKSVPFVTGMDRLMAVWQKVRKQRQVKP